MADSGSNGTGVGSIPAPQVFTPSRNGEVVSDPASAGPGAARQEVGPLYEFGYRVAERFGIPAVLLVIVLWWARTDLIQPLLDAHFSFLGKISTAQEKHVSELQNIGDKLDTLIRISDDK
jgi:hypothetical protein